MQYLFIVTYGRTGSTAVQMALNALPGYCIRGENGGAFNHLASAAMAIAKAKEVHSESASDPKSSWYGTGNADLASLESALSESFTRNVLQPPEDATTVGFKEVRYWRQSDEEFNDILNFMTRNFDPKFIFLTRDPAAVSQSGWWPKQKDALSTIEAAKARMVQAHKRYPSFLIDHAEFAENPTGIAPLIEWLGEDPAPAIEALSVKLTHMQKESVGSLRQKIGSKIRQTLG